MKCANCGKENMLYHRQPAKTPGWAIAIAILFFPLGLIALSAKKPAKNVFSCDNCGYETKNEV